MKKLLSVVTLFITLAVSMLLYATSHPEDRYFITSDCVACGACVDVCPVGAIHPNYNYDYDSIYQIDPDLCVDCGACKDECPIGAIKEGH